MSIVSRSGVVGCAASGSTTMLQLKPGLLCGSERLEIRALKQEVLSPGRNRRSESRNHPDVASESPTPFISLRADSLVEVHWVQ